jgi:Fur family peroxide stress response transcriptional regulator
MIIIPVEEIKKKLVNAKLKVTPQRINILKAVYELDNHPTADNVKERIRETNPNIATGTVYNVLETFVKNNLVKKVKTDKDIMRYDGLIHNHHHLYCTECDLIEDYNDEDLDLMLRNYFKKKKFKGFKVDDIVLQIRGTFDKC